MVALRIILIIVLVIFLIGLIPIGADISYENSVLTVSAKVGSILLKLFPKEKSDEDASKKKKKKEKKPKKKKAEDESGQNGKPKKKLKLNFTVDEIISLLKKVLKGLGKLLRIKISRFKLYLVVTGDDPYSTAMTYGAINAALSSLLPLCEERFGMKNEDVYTDVDFMADSWSVDFGIAITIRIGQIFGALNTILFGALGILIKNKVRLRRERRLNPPEPEKHPDDTSSQDSQGEADQMLNKDSDK